MNLRDALINQSPSLALQRAAQQEIAGLDSDLMDLSRRLSQLIVKVSDLEDYLESQGLTQEFEEWLKRNTEE